MVGVFVCVSPLSHLDHVHHSPIRCGQPGDVRVLSEIRDVRDGELQAVEGEEGGEVGGVEGGDDHDEEPPRCEENPGGV